MAYIGREPVIGNFVKLDAISVVNGQAAYTMNNGGSAFTAYDNVNQFLVSLNGILQAPTDSFTVSGSTLTFASNLATGDVIDFVIVLGNTLDVGTPSDSTVSLAKLTATGTKDATTFLRGDNTFAAVTAPGLVKLSTTTISSPVTAVNFDSSIVSGYNYYQVRMSNVGVSADADDIGIKLSGDNGSNFGTIQATRTNTQQTNSGSGSPGSTGGYTYHPLSEDSEATESTDGHTSAIIDIFNASNSSNHKHIISHSFTKNQNGNWYGYWNVSRNQLTAAVNYIRIHNTANNLDSGTFTLYGVTS